MSADWGQIWSTTPVTMSWVEGKKWSASIKIMCKVHFYSFYFYQVYSSINMRFLGKPNEVALLILRDILHVLIDMWRDSVCFWFQTGQEYEWELILSASHIFPHPPDSAMLCKYQQWASCLLCFSKASATLLTFIYISCQRITFLSYERLSRPACLNVVTHKFIIRTLGARLKGQICDPTAYKRVAPHHQHSKHRIGISCHYQIGSQQQYLCC